MCSFGCQTRPAQALLEGHLTMCFMTVLVVLVFLRVDWVVLVSMRASGFTFFEEPFLGLVSHGSVIPAR